jgi:TrmH family RNA methyltransferase
MGSIFHTPVTREIQSLPLLEEARASGFVSAAAVPSGGERPSNIPAEKLVFVVGSEGGGLPEEVISACRRSVTIPTLAASLNAAVAASILLYEAYIRVLP